MTSPAFVLLSLVARDGRPNRAHHLADALGQLGHPVLWIDPPSIAGSTDADPRPVSVAPGVEVLAPGPGLDVLSPLTQGPWARRARDALGAWRPAGARVVVLVQTPVLARAALRLGGDLVVHDAIDDWRHGPGGPDVRTEGGERTLAREAALVVAASERVAARFRGLGGRAVEVIPNGCWPDRWTGVETASPIDALAAAPRPRLVYWGGLDDGLAVDDLRAVAAALPGATIALVGPEVPGSGARARLEGLPGALLPGAVSHDELTRWAAGADALMVPFAPTPFNEARDCLKLWEYLATGRPVAATSFAHARRLGGVIEVADPADGAQGLARACERALASATDVGARERRCAAARDGAWPRRAADLVAAVTRRLERA